MSPRVGLVVRVDAKVCHVEVGERLQAVPRGTLFEELGARKNPIAVGDRVEVSLEGDPPGIETVLERRNYLGRVASSHDPREQVLVAANVDALFVVGSLVDPGFSSNRTDRILAACAWHGVPAALVLNKIDLVERDEVDAVRATYEAVPIEVLETCAKDGRGVPELAARLEGRVTVLYGPSGAGKSTLLNRIQPGLRIKEGRISRYWRQGKHTTTFSTMHRLPGGGYVVDTPGIRVFRLHGALRELPRDARGARP
jgi:ribosome biogenesis GTPase